MTAKEQEKLFERLLRRGESAKYASGYVHGVFDESTGRPAPNPMIRFRVPDHSIAVNEDPYAYGYMIGFIDSYGEDAFDQPWGGGLSWLKCSLRFRWWL